MSYKPTPGLGGITHTTTHPTVVKARAEMAAASPKTAALKKKLK